jgi:hypothetical protein
MTDTPMLSWGRLSARRSIIGAAGELIALLGVLGFAGSIIVNTLVFRHWRLNFIQIASSSDVLTTGVDGSLRFVLIALVLMAPAIAVYVVRVDRRVPTKQRSYAVMACLVFSLILMVGLVEFIGRPFSARAVGLYWHVLMVSAIVGGISMAAVLQFLLIEADSKENSGDRKLFFGFSTRWLSSPYPVVILVMIVISGSEELNAVLDRYGAAGYLGSPHYMSLPPSGCEGRVLWIGERALVITCGRDRLQHYAVVGTLNTPNLVICEFPFAGGPAGRCALPAPPKAAPASVAAVVTPPPAVIAPPREVSASVAATARRPHRRPPSTPQALQSSATPAGGVGSEPDPP